MFFVWALLLTWIANEPPNHAYFRVLTPRVTLTLSNALRDRVADAALEDRLALLLPLLLLAPAHFALVDLGLRGGLVLVAVVAYLRSTFNRERPLRGREVYCRFLPTYVI